jgi:hypothetical protein
MAASAAPKAPQPTPMKTGLLQGSSTGGVMDSLTKPFQKFGDFANENKGLMQMSLGAIGSIGEAQKAEAKMKEEARVRDEARARYNNSILNQRQAY